MAKGDNPFDPEDPAEYVPVTAAPPPQVPISGNPFEAAPANAPPPATLTGNVADVLQPAATTFSFGMRNRLEGLRQALTGEAPSYSAGVDRAVAEEKMRRERSPYLSVAGDVLGGTAQAFVPGVGAIGRTTAAALGGAGRGALPTAARMAGYGLEGGVLGAAQAAGQTYTGNPEDYGRNATIGGAFGAVLGAPFGRFADVAPRSLAAVPNSADLFASSRGHYQATHTSPMRYDTSMMRGSLDAFENDLQSPAYGVVKVPENKTFAVIDYLRNLNPHDPAGYSPYEIDAARKQLTGVTDPGSSAMRQWLDNYMISPHGVSVGTPTDQGLVAHWLDLARGDYRAHKRTQAVELTNQYAADRADVANSQMNVGNTYAQRLTSTFLNPKAPEYKWATPAERAEVRAVTRRDPFYTALNRTSNILGGGLGAGAGLYGGGGALGAFTSGDWRPFAAGVAIPAVGYVAKTAGNRAMVNSAEELANTFARNSPLYRSRVPYAPEVAGPGLGNVAESTRNAITLEMLNQLRLRGAMNAPTEE